MNQRIVYTNTEGSVSVILPAPEWFAPDEEGNVKTIEELAAKDVPQGLTWRIVDVSALPASRNWRNAWTDANPTETVDVDLEKAKEAHKALMVAKALQRIQPDAFGQRDVSQVKAEIDALPVDAVTSLQDLYNLWPESIEKRTSTREYRMHAEV